MQMFRIFLHDGSQHVIPVEDRTAEDLAIQLSTIFSMGANVLSMRIANEPSVEEINKKSTARNKKTA